MERDSVQRTRRWNTVVSRNDRDRRSNAAAPLVLTGLTVEILVLGGRDLVAKDFHPLGRRRRTSDPYAEVWWGGELLGRTKTVKKTLRPEWNERLTFRVGSVRANALRRRRRRRPGEGRRRSGDEEDDDGANAVELRLFDEDRLSRDDGMGRARVPLRAPDDGGDDDDEIAYVEWYPVDTGDRGTTCWCGNAAGEVQVRVRATARRALAPRPGAAASLPSGTVLRVSVEWEARDDVVGGALDLDASCVVVTTDGEVDVRGTVYHGSLINPNGSVRHAGDDRGPDDESDETIECDLARVPRSVLALYLLVTVATPRRTFGDARSVRAVLDDARTDEPLWIHDAAGSDGTALFLARAHRRSASSPNDWILTAIGDFDRTSRDFGSLVPEIKAYTRDLLPDIRVDTTERVAVLRKDAVVRLRDYAFRGVRARRRDHPRGRRSRDCDDNNDDDEEDELQHDSRRPLPSLLTFGLAWDTAGSFERAVDLDASVLSLNADLDVLDIVYYNNLRSRDGAVTHYGDERRGAVEGFDERIALQLDRVDRDVRHLCVVVTSYSGQGLDRVRGARCELYDPATGRALARHDLSRATRARDGEPSKGALLRTRNLRSKLTSGGGASRPTALLVADVFRRSEHDDDDDDDDDDEGEWYLRALSRPAEGRSARCVAPCLVETLRRECPARDDVVASHRRRADDLARMPTARDAERGVVGPSPRRRPAPPPTTPRRATDGDERRASIGRTT